MQIGMRVRYIHEDTEYDKRTGFFPPIGTFGTVERVDSGPKGKEQILVQWDSGTIGDGKWWCYWTDVEVVEGEGVNMFVIMYGVCPTVVVETEAEAQELVADLSWEFAHYQFNLIMQSAYSTPKRAMDMTEFRQYWYKEVPKI